MAILAKIGLLSRQLFVTMETIVGKKFLTQISIINPGTKTFELYASRRCPGDAKYFNSLFINLVPGYSVDKNYKK